MAEPVKTRRAYHAPRRTRQAARTRAAVLSTARELFLAQGYAATTLPQIAGAAEVSVETIYKAFGNKAGLLKAVFDVSVVGDDNAVPLLQREHIARMRAEPDVRRVLRMYGEHIAESTPRSVPVQLLIKAAAATEPAVATLWLQLEEQRLTGMTVFATDLAARGALRQNVSVEHARDVLWSYTAPEWYQLLVLKRGWTPQRLGAWIAEALTAALLG